MKPCPRCGQPSESSPWPYLKGIDANNVVLEWRRCASCNALFSQLTPDLAVMERQCGCEACRVAPHASWCAVHNEPAMAKGVCTCDLTGADRVERQDHLADRR